MPIVSSGPRFAQIIAVLPIAINGFCMGLGYGWVSPSVKYFQTQRGEFYFNDKEISWIASLHELGRCSSPLVVGMLINVLGRKKLIISSSVMFVIAWTSITFTKSIFVLSGARYLFGLGLGCSDVACGVYVAELAPPDIRGKSFSIINTLVILGLLCSYVLGAYLPYRVFSAIILAATIICLGLSVLLVETPQYLIARGKDESAIRNLTRLLGNDSSQVQHEFDDIKNHLTKKGANNKIETSNISAIVFDRANIKIFSLVIAISMLGRATGYHPIIYYSSTIFPASDDDDGSWLTSNQFTIFFGVIQVISLFLSTLFIDKYGRRFLLLTFSSLTIVFHIITLALYFAVEKLDVKIPCFSWLIFVTLAWYLAFYTFGYVPTNYALRAELFPHNLKGVGGAISIIGQSGASFLLIKTFFVVKNMDGIYLTFLPYILASILIFCIVYFKLPETKGKTLAEIQRLF